jgi:hypothetical protein
MGRLTSSCRKAGEIRARRVGKVRKGRGMKRYAECPNLRLPRGVISTFADAIYLLKSGYRNRLLPLPIKHCQPQAFPRIHAPPLTAEPVWMHLMPIGHVFKQYVIFWYIAETIPPSLEAELETAAGDPYKPPPPYPTDLLLKERVKMEPEGYQPIHHEGTGVDEEEATYKSYLLPVSEATEKLGRRSVMADVVLRGWQGIQDRYALEDGADTKS